MKRISVYIIIAVFTLISINDRPTLAQQAIDKNTPSHERPIISETDPEEYRENVAKKEAGDKKKISERNQKNVILIFILILLAATLVTYRKQVKAKRPK